MKKITITAAPAIEKFFVNLLLSDDTWEMSIPDSQQSILTSVVDAFLATNTIRYGAIPNVESVETITSVIQHCIQKNCSIPVLCPWGSKKPKNHETIDVAELMALHALDALQSRVRKYYDPGISVNLRIDDISGYHLFFGQDGAEESSKRYVNDFLLLIKILGYDFIQPVPESLFVNKENFFIFAEETKIIFLDYLQQTDKHGFEHIDSLNSWNTLKKLGWSGQIPLVMREFFKKQYDVMYKNISEVEKEELLARYFAGTVTRMHFHATGKEQEWGNNFLQLNFLPVAPGTPSNIVSNRLSYRTINEKFGRTHIPPWRAKGFLEITNEVKPKLTSWFNQEINSFDPSWIIFSSDEHSVCLNACQKKIH